VADNTIAIAFCAQVFGIVLEAMFRLRDDSQVLDDMLPSRDNSEH